MKRILHYVLTLSLLLFLSLSIFSCVVIEGLGTITSIVGAVANNPVLEAAGNATSSVIKAATPITPENEYYIGRSVAANILGTYKIYDNPKATKYVNMVLQTLVLNSDCLGMYKGYRAAILDTKQINAFATPGGHILVTRGLLEYTDSEDALAAVLAHEISHINLQHGLNAIKTDRWTNAAVAVTGAVLSSINEDLATIVVSFDETISTLVTTVVNTGYSKEQEYEADVQALSVMSSAGYNPHAMKDMLTLLKAKSSRSSGGFVSTHPSASSRLRKVKKALKKHKEIDIPKIRIDRFQEAIQKI